MTLDELIDTVARGGPCDARGLARAVTSEDITAILAAAPKQDSMRVLGPVDFSGVEFVGPVSFRGVRFEGDAMFARARFRKEADFAGIHGGRCAFKGATFDDELYADGWEARTVDFENATFNALARFYNITADLVSFSGSTFNARTAFCDIKATTFFNFVGVVFAERVLEFVAGTRYLHLQRSRLERGGVFYLHGGQADLAGAELGAATMLAGSTKTGRFRRETASLVVDGAGWRPRLLSLEEIDAENLTLQDVDLSRCRFVGAMNLDRLRLEGLCLFDAPPRGLIVGRTPPWIWRWTERTLVYEERIWRSLSPRASGWRIRPARRRPDEPMVISSEGDPFARATPSPADRRAEAEQLAKVYRALRKGHEDAKNEPGAGDFYYGEMEMRRAGTASAGERFVIWLYWLIAGYGLRPLRPLLALVTVLGLGSVLLVQVGFSGARSYAEAFLASLAASVNLEYLPPEAFTVTGQWIRIVLRILGPTLFGLMLLASWGRVKR